ncbi:unnamed protein product [Rotaria sp. Silwood1]|nr:unnamed protein product [Rotaria sp. Silwood1]CAF1600850.1 unnamed protein product [Rotaria sp. Silwood1]
MIENSILTSHVPFQNLSSIQKESTIFERVYGNRRRRPYTISLNLQWEPVIYHTNTYKQSGNDLNNRILKTKTFFDNCAIREQQQTKAITPPSSDYTDAYLSAFAPKLIPTRRIHRLTSPIFAHVKPIPLEPIRTYLSTNDKIRTSQTRFNNIQNLNLFDKNLPFSSNRNSTLTSNFFPNISTKDEPFSNIQTFSSETQTIDSNNSTSIDQPSLPKLSTTTYQFESSKDNIDKSISYPSRPSTLSSSYKPSILFQSVSSSSLSNDINSNSINKQTILSSSNIEKQIETYLLQNNEENSSIIHIKTNIDPEQTPTDELLTISSKPIQILENTINEYDSLINQISDILATVSPLSSTVSSMSPGQSVLDYEFTADGSPILKRKNIESQLSEQPIVSITNMNRQHEKAKYLIRDDSYDKIIIAMEDLDSELTPPPPLLDIQKSTITIEQEKNENIKTLLDEHQTLPSSEQIQEEIKTSSLLNNNHEESKILLINEKQLSSITKQIEDEHSISSISSLNEIKLENTKLSSNNEIYTTNDNIVLDNDDDDDDDNSSLYLSLTEEINSSKASIIISEDESKSIDKQQINTSNTEDNQIIVSNSIEQQIKSSSPFEISTSFSNSIEQRSTSSDIIESQSSHSEHTSNSISSTNIKFISGIDTSNQKDINQQFEEIESNKIKTSTEFVDDTTNHLKTSTISLLPNIISPIDTLTNSISTRYISSDVYYGYQGEHRQFIENLSNVNNDNTMISLLTSLRQTIKSPITPLIETIQSVVSSMQTITTIEPLINERKLKEHSQNETIILNEMILNSKKDINEYETHIEENKQNVHIPDESKSVLNNIYQTVTETMEAILTNLQKEQQEILSTSNKDQIFTEDDLTILQLSPSKDNLNETTLTLSSLLDSIQENVSDTIPTFIENIQNIIPTDLSSTQIQKSKEHIEISTSLDISHKKSLENLMNESISLTSEIPVVTNEQIEHKENIITSFEIPIQLSTEDRTIETDTIQYDEKVSTDKTENKTIENILPTHIIQDEHVPKTLNLTNSEQMTNEIKISSDNTIQSLIPIAEKIDSVISSVSTEENLPLLEQVSDNEKIASLVTDSFVHTPNNELTLEINENILKTVHNLIDDIIHTVILHLQEIPISDKSIIVQIDNIMQQSINESESDSTSFKTEIENIQSKLIIDRCESSGTTTEPNSSELVHALRGHSIILPNIIFRPPEKSSSSTTTSSQVTSSDRYISYAIHQMNDSSQEHLPTIPLAADIPIYKNIFLKSNNIINSLITKEDDSTEYDATENLTSYTDDIHDQKFNILNKNKQQHLDTSSTDDDVDEEFEQHDLTNINQLNNNLNENNESYQFYDPATSPSSNNSSSSLRQQSDDVYLIPGYPGLWKPSTNNYNSNLPKEYDADDESKTTSENQTIIRTLHSTKRPLVFQHIQDETINLTYPEILTNNISLQTDIIDLINQSLDDNLLDRSESDTYQTCQSSISKYKKKSKLNEIKTSDEQDQTSTDESIFLIRERERGVSLPITMKIDCDDIALRLSTSTPIDNPLLYKKLSFDLSSSTHSEPPLLPIHIDSNSQPSSSSLNNNENEQQKLPSWLNTVTTTGEESNGQRESRITFLKSAKGPICISQCNSQGNYIMIENTSQSKNIDLSNWTIRQENDNGDNLIFIFPDNCYLGPNQSLKILTKTHELEQTNNDLIASSLSSWHTSPNILTILYNSEGKVSFI